MAKFMQGFGDDQREGETEQAFGGKRLDHGAGEHVPLLQYQNNPQHAETQYQHPGQRMKQPAQGARQMLQRLLRAQQRDTEKQVVVQPPAPG
ncbi:hypothetical protein D3C87_1253120 [compost metagenome]